MTVVILKKDMPKLGSLGDQVKVRGGYARNFLLPYGFAVEATRKNVKQIEHEKRMLEKEIRTLEAAALKNKEKIEKMTLEYTKKSSESGKLFGSVTNRDIELSLSERGVVVDRRNVTPAHVKLVGKSIVEVKLFKAIKATINVNIIPEYVVEEKPEEVEEVVEEAATNEEETVNEEVVNEETTETEGE